MKRKSDSSRRESTGMVQHQISEGSQPSFSKRSYEWIRFIVNSSQAFSCVNDPSFVKFSRFLPIPHEMVIRYVEALCQRLNEEIKATLPERFGLIIGGWVIDQKRYVVIFSSFISDSLPMNHLLGLTYLPDITDQKGQDLAECISNILIRYSKTAANVAFVVANNDPVYTEVVHLWNIPFIGCYVDRLNAAVDEYLENEDRMHLIGKVHNLFTAITASADIMRKLKKLIDIQPTTFALTGWLSKYEMIWEYRSLHDTLRKHDKDLRLSDKGLLLTWREMDQLEELGNDLQSFLEIYRSWQKPNLNLLSVHRICELLCDDYPAFESHLGLETCSTFENAVVHCLEGRFLTKEDKDLLSAFRKAKVHQETENEGDRQTKKPRRNYADVIKEASEKKTIQAEFQDLTFITPTTAIVERSFPEAKQVYSEGWRSMTFEHLEMANMLRVNPFLTMEKIEALVDVLGTGETEN